MIYDVCVLITYCTFCYVRIVGDVGLRPVGRSWHTFTPITSGQIFLYGGYTNEQVPLGEYRVLFLHRGYTNEQVPLGKYQMIFFHRGYTNDM